MTHKDNFYLELEKNKVPELQQMAKKRGLKYKEYGTMKKAELIEYLLSPEPKEDKAVIKEQLEKDVQDHIENGGEVKQCRSQRPPKRVAPTEKSAEKNVSDSKSKKRGRPNKGLSRKPVRTAENVITLQEILEPLGISGTKARKLLRSSDIEKPGKQWVWDKEKQKKEIKAVTTFFKKSVEK